MKYCSHCGKELNDEAVVCVGCGCSVHAKNTSNNKSLKTVSLVFMYISCALPIFISLIMFIAGSSLIGYLAVSPLIMGFTYLIPLAWMLPMTVVLKNKIKNNESIGVGFKVCTLLFCSIISGICLLCVNDD